MRYPAIPQDGIVCESYNIDDLVHHLRHPLLFILVIRLGDVKDFGMMYIWSRRCGLASFPKQRWEGEILHSMVILVLIEPEIPTRKTGGHACSSDAVDGCEPGMRLRLIEEW